MCIRDRTQEINDKGYEVIHHGHKVTGQGHKDSDQGHAASQILHVKCIITDETLAIQGSSLAELLQLINTCNVSRICTAEGSKVSSQGQNIAYLTNALQ